VVVWIAIDLSSDTLTNFDPSLLYATPQTCSVWVSKVWIHSFVFISHIFILLSLELLFLSYTNYIYYIYYKIFNNLFEKKKKIILLI